MQVYEASRLAEVKDDLAYTYEPELLDVIKTMRNALAGLTNYRLALLEAEATRIVNAELKDLKKEKT